ncbi:hypothetical protein HNV12_15650 [Methanococcoides sp. SA1]|nr:hypothetical protein [Methanococcoides sp. SA1]
MLLLDLFTFGSDLYGYKPVSLKSVGKFENVHTIFSVIADLAKSHPQKLVHINDVCNECMKQGLSCDSTKEVVSKLKNHGDLLALKPELFRMVV